MLGEREVVGTALKFLGETVGAEGEGMQWRANKITAATQQSWLFIILNI